MSQQTFIQFKQSIHGRSCSAQDICDFLIEAIESGTLASGERLPTVRELSALLEINYATVASAWASAKASGLIESKPGKGSYVRATLHAERPEADSRALMNSPFTTHSSRLLDAMRDAAIEAIRRPQFRELLNYQDITGSDEIRAAGLRWLQARMAYPSADLLLPSAGIHGALVALFSLPGRSGAIALPPFFYPGIKAIAASLNIKLIETPADNDGPLPEELDTLCRREPIRALYLNPTINNPTAVTISLERRQALAAVARRHHLTIIEDDAYGALAAQSLPTFCQLVPELTWYIGGLSKSLAPGIRMAWICAPSAIERGYLASTLNALTLMPNPLVSGVVSQWIFGGVADLAASEMRQEARARHQLVIRLLAGRDFQASPQGFHLWLRLPGLDASAIAAKLRQMGISALASHEFSLSSRCESAIRLCTGGNISHQQCELMLTTTLNIIDNPSVISSVAI
ncbi:transcriptional regulator [Salmonella enterica subsp. enterica serovar Choleraesuis]|nr:transcriptional regulator [Salmonella enterica subsp. enterica serovar Choleraesuis]